MSLGESASPIGKVTHTGASGHGGDHWLRDKVISAGLVLLGAWFVASLVLLPSLDQRTITLFLREPYGAVPMALFVVASFHHAYDGLKVVIDDYVHDDSNRFALKTVAYFLAIGGGAVAVFALAKIAFGAAA